MYAVIFRAQINQLDKNYTEMASRMKELALGKYGCIDFVSVTEGTQEIAISYWQNLEQIQKWKQDPEHITAQALGTSTWYKSYKVQIVEIMREYSNNS